MNNRIFKAIWIVGITVFLASLVLIMGVSYDYFSSTQRKQLRIETELAAQGVALSGAEYFNELNTKDYRITWVSATGSVLFDNGANAATMQNHLERQEIAQAISKGFGEATRKSYTLDDEQFYAAKLLPDGSVLRLSIRQLSVVALLFGFAQPICVVILIALILSFFLASRLSKAIMKPINEIDLSTPDQYYGKDDYKEIEPLLRHISTQQSQLIRDKEEIERASLIRQEFSANVSHELKTPLQSISGYAELLENGLVKEDDIKPFAEKIHKESLRMTRLIEDIIDLTKLDNGGAEMKWEDCDLLKITENAVDSLEAAALAMDISINIEGKNALMQGIPQMLYSIVYNLCDNAIKYSYSKGIISIVIEQNDSYVILKVRDKGIGIPPDEQERIFERFYRVDKSRSREVGGTGLGLSIVKHAVIIHNGSIRLNSTPGEGSEFIITLPKEGSLPK